MSSSNLTSSPLIYTRYAGALIDLAEQEKIVNKVQKDLSALGNALEASEELSKVISSPLINVSKHASVLEELAQKMKMQPLTKKFLGVLAGNRRLGALLGIIRAYEKIVTQQSGLVEVSVQTAEALSKDQLVIVKDKIEKALKTSIELEEKVSPKIMGGMVVTIGSYMIDDSVRRKVERLGMVLKSSANQEKSVSNVKEVG
ncbi:MAG: ATP synthase F1 subunit delta [Alphaproteobacteria bacterium]|nr:ATP synthase F1 subunit delta [Alphaproteobacteria bacterium]